MAPFQGLTSDICQLAFDQLIRPVINQGAAVELLNKKAGCLIVLDPALPFDPKYGIGSGNELFEELVLWQTSFGDVSTELLNLYHKYARAKAWASYMTGLPSHLVQQQHPELFLPGMTKWGGSAVSGVGPMRLIAAFSGVQWNYDQMISQMTISAIQAICLSHVPELMADDAGMIGQQTTSA